MTQLEIILTITIGVMVFGTCLYFYFRPDYEYYEAEIMTEESNVGDILIFYNDESRGHTIRKSKKTGNWQVVRRDWYKLFGVYHKRFRWRQLTEPYLSLVQQKLKQGEKITLMFSI